MNRLGTGGILRRVQTLPRVLFARRTLINPDVQTKNLRITSEREALKPGETLSSNVKNGTVGQPLFPGHTLFRTIKQEIPKLGEALAALVLLFVVIPYGLKMGSDYLFGVPDRDRTSAVTFTKEGPKADIPQTFAPIDKPEDDEEEEEEEAETESQPEDQSQAQESTESEGLGDQNGENKEGEDLQLDDGQEVLKKDDAQPEVLKKDDGQDQGDD